MRTYEELVSEFVSRGHEEKQKWIDELPIEEMDCLMLLTLVYGILG